MHLTKLGSQIQIIANQVLKHIIVCLDLKRSNITAQIGQHVQGKAYIFSF